MRHGSIGMILAVVALLGPVASARANEPIEGVWQIANLGVMDFVQTGPNAFTGHPISRDPTGSCANSPLELRVTGSGNRYTGAIPYYQTSTCASVGDGRVDITLEASGLGGTARTSPPPGFACCLTTDDMFRISPELESTLPPLVNRYYVALAVGEQQVGRSRKNRRKSLFRSLEARARSIAATIKKFRATDPDDIVLRSCSIAALTTVRAGAQRRRADRVASGLRALRACLAPYADILPGRRAGGAPNIPQVKPGTPPNSGHFVGSGPGVSNFEFDNVGDVIRQFVYTVRVSCSGRFSDAGYQSFASPHLLVRLDAKGRFDTGPVTQRGDRLTVVARFIGTVTGGRAQGTMTFTGTFDEGQAFTTCTTGTLSWTAGKR